MIDHSDGVLGVAVPVGPMAHQFDLIVHPFGGELLPDKHFLSHRPSASSLHRVCRERRIPKVYDTLYLQALRSKLHFGRGAKMVTLKEST